MNSAGAEGEKGTNAKRTGPLFDRVESERRLGVSELRKVIASFSETF